MGRHWGIRDYAKWSVAGARRGSGQWQRLTEYIVLRLLLIRGSRGDATNVPPEQQELDKAAEMAVGDLLSLDDYLQLQVTALMWLRKRPVKQF